jgi:hypothetical protein
MKPDGYEAEYDSDGLKRMGICAVCTVEPYTINKLRNGDFKGMQSCKDCADQVLED